VPPCWCWAKSAATRSESRDRGWKYWHLFGDVCLGWAQSQYGRRVPVLAVDLSGDWHGLDGPAFEPGGPARPVPEEINGGSASSNLTRQLGGSFGIALLTSFLSHGRDDHRAYLIESAGALSQQLRLRLLELERMLHVRGAEPQLAHRRALELVDRQVDLQASLLAYADIFHLLAILFLAAIPLVLLFRAPKVRRAG